MKEHLTVIMLAGALRPTPLHLATDLPPCCLPISPGRSLFASWVDRIVGDVDDVSIRIVVTSEADASRISPEAARVCSERGVDLRVIVEPASWRGTAGLLADATLDIDNLSAPILTVEASVVPPSSLTPLLEGLTESVDGALAASSDNEPMGVGIFRRGVFNLVPEVGYLDLKEQLLPVMHETGRHVAAIRYNEPARRIRDLTSYLEVIAHHRGEQFAPRSTSGEQTVFGSLSAAVRVEGATIIEPDVTFQGPAIIQDSIVLAGATIERNAIVGRSVIGPFARVEAGATVVEQLVPAPPNGAFRRAQRNWPNGDAFRRESA